MTWMAHGSSSTWKNHPKNREVLKVLVAPGECAKLFVDWVEPPWGWGEMGENPAESKGEDGFEGDTQMMGDGEDEHVEEGLVGPTYWWSKNPLQYVYTFIVV